jgi:transcriptional regulator with GAF, ATPase, and Fis domain
MERFLHLLLQVWQQACRHIRIEESASAIAKVLAGRLPLNGMLVRGLDPSQGRLETIADTGPAALVPNPGVLFSSERAKDLPRWCASQRVVRGPAEEIRGQVPGLLPGGLDGGVIAAGLLLEGEPIGALILLAAAPDAFAADHEPMLAALLDPLAVAVQNDRQLRELSALREAAEADRASLLARLGRQDIADTVIGAETGLREVLRRVDLVARANTPVLIFGETGTGKEVVARAIHTRSRRAAGPFLRVNCGAIPSELIDSELFGHERGSFTGAAALRKGWFERADGGSLFLDEVGELSPGVQVRLLRILQDGTFQRVGGQQQLRVDVRVVAATHRDLRTMVGEGRFREDLWYRINVFPIHLPALRERAEDIPAMATHFALRAAQRLGLAPQAPSREDIALLVAYPWPGNVRELAAVIERAAILGDGRGLEVAQALGVVHPAPLVREPSPMQVPGGARQTAATLDQVARRHIEEALTQTLGRIEGPFGAARRLGINPHTLRARMRKLGIDWRRFRTPTDC